MILPLLGWHERNLGALAVRGAAFRTRSIRKERAARSGPAPVDARMRCRNLLRCARKKGQIPPQVFTLINIVARTIVATGGPGMVTVRARRQPDGVAVEVDVTPEEDQGSPLQSMGRRSRSGTDGDEASP